MHGGWMGAIFPSVILKTETITTKIKLINLKILFKFTRI